MTHTEDEMQVIRSVPMPKRRKDEMHVVKIVFYNTRVKKALYSMMGKGNNWRRMHGQPLIRVPLKERRMA